MWVVGRPGSVARASASLAAAVLLLAGQRLTAAHLEPVRADAKSFRGPHRQPLVDTSQIDPGPLSDDGAFLSVRQLIPGSSSTAWVSTAV